MIHYKITGAHHTLVPTLVFVHGLTCDGDDWIRQQEAFGVDNCCITVDLRGHGRSGDMPPPYNIETLAEDLVAVLLQHDIRNAILIGHSMGTRVIIAAHLHAPDRVSGLIFVDGSKQANGDPGTAVAAIESNLQHQHDVSVFTRSLFEAMFTDRSETKARESIINRAVNTPADMFRAMLGNMLAWDAGHMLNAIRQVKIPVTVLQSTNVDENRVRRCLADGENTPYLQLLQRHMPQADIRIVANTGHFTQLDAPKPVNQAIREMSDALTVN